MDNQAGRGRGATKKVSVGSRRVWTNREEAVLITSLKDLVANGWKSDNGFRGGYLNKLEDSLKSAFPNTDLQKDPHIISKLTSWRKYYGSLVSAQRNNTGIGFNTTTNMLEVSDDQWDSIVKKDHTMKGLRYKEWPLFTDWIEVFGKDRATGEIAEDVPDAAATMHSQLGQSSGIPFEQEGMADNGDDGCNFVNLEAVNDPPHSTPMEGGNGDNSTACHANGPSPSNVSKKRKNRAESVEPTIASVLENFCRSTNEWRETMATRIGYEKDLGQLRTKVYGLLSNVPGLSMSDKMDATELIGSRNDRLEIFTGITEEARAMYAMRLLERERSKMGPGSFFE